MTFAQHINKGFGPEWTGIVFRRTYPELEDVIKRSRQWFPRIFPGARYNKNERTWYFPKGEMLKFRHVMNESDCDHYIGHEYPFIFFNELTKWPTPGPYEMLRACCRSAHPGMPHYIISDTNPLGPGHDWVKEYWIDPTIPGVPYTETVGSSKRTRVRLRFMTIDNQKLLTADTEYLSLLSSTRDPLLRKAWFLGDWNVDTGGMFNDLWNITTEKKLFIKPFRLPESWTFYRSFDYGYSSPFSVGWWAVSDGTDAEIDNKTVAFPPGSHFRIEEWYGSQRDDLKKGLRLSTDEIALGIAERERQIFPDYWWWPASEPVWPGPADTEIYNDKSDQDSYAEIMERRGVYWTEADKSKGSRAFGCNRIREMLTASLNESSESPHLYVFQTCNAWKRTVPNLQRDPNNLDVTDKGQPDHACDESRYMVTWKPERATLTEGRWEGV